MKLREVLARKQISGVATISEQETLLSLTKMLQEKGIGAAIVSRTGRDVAGVISERDVIRAVSQGGASCLSEPVNRHMTVDVKTAAPEDSVESVLGRMTKGRFRHMPVISGGQLVGVVSIGDLVKAQIDALVAEKAALEEYVRS